MSEQQVKVVKLSQASDVAKIISNKTAQSIIEFIGSKQKATASQIAKHLELPASTVHYNMKALVKGGIVDDSQFSYSSKGKTIIHYTLTNNILVIVPESHNEFAILDSLKAIVPSLLGVGVLAGVYAWFSRQSVNEVGATALKAAPRMATITAEADMAESFNEVALQAASAPPVPESISWWQSHEFLAGALIATIVFAAVFIVYTWLRSRKKK